MTAGRSNVEPSNLGRKPSLLWAPLLVIAGAAFAVEIPFFFWGTPSGHDVEFHLYSWLEVLAQWKQGIVYPRWAALAHFGYGEPRFVFYPPASWTLGAVLSWIFPWTIASSVYVWVVLVAAGASMFWLVRQWLDRHDAIFAATFYAVNPYHVVIVYWRSAFAELLASCLVPLLLLLVLKAADEGRRWIVPLALVLAAAWLTNAPAAVMIHYSLALLLVLLAWRRRSSRVLLVGATAIVLGACLTSFYLLPAIYEQKWVNIAEAISQGSRPQDNVLFIHTTDPDHDAFNHIVSWIAVLEIAATVAAVWAAKWWRQSQHELWNVLLGWAIASSVVMFPVTLPLWKFLPKMEFMQFPWRWLLCLSMMFSIFVTLGVRRWWMRGAVCVVAVLVIATSWYRIQAPWWDNAGDLREMQDNMLTGVGYEGTDEYTPVGADPSATDKDARKVTIAGPARGAIHVLQWNAEFKSFTADVSAPDQLALRLFPYPAWRVEVNGRLVETTARESTGQMLVPVETGMNRVQMRFVQTWDRTVGGGISFVTVFALFAWTIRSRRRATAG